MKKRLLAFILTVALLWCSVPVLSLAVGAENADGTPVSQTENVNGAEGPAGEPGEPNEPGGPTPRACALQLHGELRGGRGRPHACALPRESVPGE